MLAIYDATDIHKMMEDIKNEKAYYCVSIKDTLPKFGKVTRIEFGKAEKYAMIASARNYAVYSMEAGKTGLVCNDEVNPDLYARIMDVQMTSEGCKEGDFKLYVACDVYDVNRIDIFDDRHKETGEIWSITHAMIADTNNLFCYI